MNLRIVLLLALLLVAPCATSFAAIVDFTTWTPVADPADPNFTSSATVSSASIQVANGSIPVGTDIGFQSVDGVTLGSSTSGSYFDPSNNFTIAIDYNLDFGAGAQGFLGLGFGIGEDGDGMNSAGVGMATFNGAPFLSFGGAARINDQDQSPLLLSLSSTLTGSLFVQYDASSGDVTVGAASTQGASAPTASDTFIGIQKQWNGQGLLTSFFVRSDGTGWQGGTAEAVFDNFRVLNGAATSVPEPSQTAGVGMCLLLVLWLARRQRAPFFFVRQRAITGVCERQSDV